MQRIVLVCHRQLVREALRAALRQSGSGSDVVEVGTVHEALDTVGNERAPALVLVHGNVEDACVVAERLGGDARVVLLTDFCGPEDLGRALSGGLAGILLDRMTVPKLAAAIGLIQADFRYFPFEDALRAMNDDGTRRVPPRGRWSWDHLTPRERQVARLVADGRPNKEIARHLGVASHTVSAHLRRMFRKLRVRNRLQLALMVSCESEAGLAPAPGCIRDDDRSVSKI